MRKTLILSLSLAVFLFGGCNLFDGGPDGGAGKQEPLKFIGVTLATAENPDAPTKNFPVESATVVVWKLSFSGDPGAGHRVEAKWYWLDGTLKWTEEREITGSAPKPVTVVGGKGYDEPGGWVPGVYTIKFFLDGAPVGEEIFRVTGEAAQSKPILLAGVDFHHAGDITEPVTVFSRDDTDTIIWFAKLSLAPGAAGDHTVTATWLDPDGKNLWTEDRAITIPEGADVKQVAGGKGYEEPGKWALGTYTLLIAVDGEPLGQATFKVGEVPPGDEVELAGTSGLGLMRIAFYNRGDYVNQMTEFENAKTEMIVWEVSLLIQPATPEGGHKLVAKWYLPDGSEKWTQEEEFDVTDADNSKRVIGGKGYTGTGNWAVGEWNLKFYLDGEFLGQKAFTIK
jgi:hypothetical protein